jgi:hypothetical protein
MKWLNERVWQLGIAVVLVLVSAVLMYVAGTDDVDQTMLWIGLGLFLIALTIPLLSKVYQAGAGETEEQG